jgi:hypothetical protein
MHLAILELKSSKARMERDTTDTRKKNERLGAANRKLRSERVTQEIMHETRIEDLEEECKELHDNWELMECQKDHFDQENETLREVLRNYAQDMANQKDEFAACFIRQMTDHEAQLSHQKRQSQDLYQRYGAVKLEKGELEAEVFRLKHELDKEKKKNAEADKLLQGIRKFSDRFGKTLDGRDDKIEQEKLKGTSEMPVVIKEEPKE